MFLKAILLFYLVSVVLSFFSFRKKDEFLDSLSFFIFLGTLLSHSVFLGIHISSFEIIGFYSPFSLVSLLSLVTIVCWLSVAYKGSIRFLAWIYTLIPFLFLLGISHPKTMIPVIKAGKIVAMGGGIHAFLSVFALCMATFSFISSVLYLILEAKLKAKEFGFWFERLPSLGILNDFVYKSTLLGFLFLTFSILSGMIYQHRLGHTMMQVGSRELMIFFSWLVYVLYFHIRFSIGMVGRKLAWIALFAYLIQVLAIFTMVGIHRF